MNNNQIKNQLNTHDKTAWLWQRPVNPAAYNENTYWPKISIVTPSFNQGQFIEETILSVLNQNYPNFEYIIIDGGSTDNTIEVIKKYEQRISYWISEKDDGQSQAINKGFEKATGEIIAWLNSDDIYARDCLKTVGLSFNNIKENEKQKFWLIGDCEAFGEISWIYKSREFTKKDLLKFWDFNIGQPSSFWSTDLVKKPIIQESLNYVMDLDLWLRLKELTSATICEKVLSYSRIYKETKTYAGQYNLYIELLETVLKHNRVLNKSHFKESYLKKEIYKHLLNDFQQKSLYNHMSTFQINSANNWKPKLASRIKTSLKLLKFALKHLIKHE